MIKLEGSQETDHYLLQPIIEGEISPFHICSLFELNGKAETVELTDYVLKATYHGRWWMFWRNLNRTAADELADILNQADLSPLCKDEGPYYGAIV